MIEKCEITEKKNEYYTRLKGLQNRKKLIETRVNDMGDNSCPICLDEIINVVDLSCGHIYCKNCILQWKERGKDICPLCRERINYVMYNNRKRTLIHLEYNICHLYIVEYCNFYYNRSSFIH